MSGNQVIPDEAVEAAAQVQCESHHWVSTNVPGLLVRWVIQCSICEAYNVEEMNAALEAALPTLLSHEREETRLAHLDAVVNADSLSKYETAIDNVLALAEYWEQTPALRKGTAAADLRAAITEALGAEE